MYFLVDPIVLCLPEPRATADQIAYFIDHLRAWNKFIDAQGGNKFYITEVCFFALADANRYPYQAPMVALIDSRPDLWDDDEEQFANANDVYNACKKIIESASSWPFFEDIESLSLPDLLVDCDKMCLHPDLVKRIPLAIAESLQETFAYVAYAKKLDNNPIASELLFLTHPIASDKIEIDVHLLVDNSDEFQHTRTDLPIVGTPEDVLRRRKLMDIWEDTRQAIDRTVIFYKDNRTIEKNQQLLPYTVAPEFNKSLQDCQFPTHSNRLDRCFEKITLLLSGTPMRNREPLRTGPGPNDDQIKEDVGKNTWKAWRLYITEGGGAVYRLHYWSSDKKYVLSHIVPHEEFDLCKINEEIVSQIE